MNDATRTRSSKGLLFGLFAIVTGAVVLVGWLFDIPRLKSVLPGFVTMKANTAVGFVLAGLSLALLGWATRAVWVRQLSRACACAMALLGLLTLSQYLFGMDFGIDQLLFREEAGAVGTLSLGRMAPVTAVNFLLLGCALFLAGFRRTIPATQRLALVTGLMGMLPLLGYAYGATELFGIGAYTQMAVHTAVLFILLSLGVLLLHPADGFMRTVTSDTVGGWLLRRLAPFVVGIPLVLGWLRVQGEQRGIFNGPLGVALMMMVMMLILTGLIWWTARALNRLGTVRRQEDAAREYAESIINTVREPLIALDQDLRVVSVSRSFYDVFKVKSEETVGQLIYDLGNKQWDIPKLRELLETILPQKATFDNYEVEHDFATIGRRIMLLNARQIKRVLGKERIILLAIEDITEKKMLERGVMKARDVAEAANKELDAFSYSVSHDLRAPLRSIDGFSHVLLEDYQGKLDATGKNYLERIRKATQHMGNLIDDLLKLSRITQSGLHEETINLSEMIQKIAQTYKKSTPGRTVKTVIQEGIIVQGDPDLMQIALTNLIDNAWKFTGKQKHPRIEFGTTLQENEKIFFVRDNGVGFDMSYVGKLFGAFQRLHTTDEFTGTGIGLATVQRIINRHEGKIWAEGEVGKGATFYFTLPA